MTDGTSQTAAASEQSLGIAGPYSQTTPTPVPDALVAGDGPRRRRPVDRCHLRRGRQRLAAQQGVELVGRQLSKRACITTTCTPNANRPDCIVYHNPGWKAARSYHPGGVNLLYCDGHVAFAKDTVNLRVWRAISTRAGGEVVSADAF